MKIGWKHPLSYLVLYKRESLDNINSKIANHELEFKMSQLDRVIIAVPDWKLDVFVKTYRTVITWYLIVLNN